MAENQNIASLSISSVFLFAGICLSGCASQPEAPLAVATEQIVISKPTEDSLRISDSERQLAEKQRQCLSEKKKLETALKDSQKQNDELRKKLDALLAIDRDLRSRGKGK